MGFGTRLLVHFFALLIALLMAGGISHPESGLTDSISLKFSVYIGLICLVPRGMGNRVDWLIPTGCGVLLILASVVTGIPGQCAVIWGGALTWLIRLLLRRGQFDWEMTALPWLFITLYSSVSMQLPLAGASPPWLSFLVLLAAGWAGTTVYGRFRGNAAQRAMLGDSCDRLEKKAASGLSPQLEKAALDLARKGRRMLRLCPHFGTDTADIVNAFAQVSERLSRIMGTPSEAATGKHEAELAKVGEKLDNFLQALEEKEKAASPQAAIDKALAARIGEFRKSASDLQEKSRQLPLKVRNHVGGIALATDRILNCMRDDPNDVSPGDRFLARYLKAAHNIVDDYTRLSAQGGEHQSIAETLARSEGLLERLQSVFAMEHEKLLQNDTINLTAELNVLDKLLKMDGR